MSTRQKLNFIYLLASYLTIFYKTGFSKVPALGRQRKAELYEFEVSLVSKWSCRTFKAVVTQGNPI